MTRTRRVRRRIGGAVIAAGLVLGAPVAAAASPPTQLPPDAALSVSVLPSSGAPRSYFDISARAGRGTVAGTLQLANHGAAPVDVELAPVPALTLNTLGSGYGTSASAATGATRWVGLSADRVRLGPHGTEVVQVMIRPPASAGPGDYLAGISVQALGQEATAQAASHGMEIADLRRYAIGVETQVPGPRHAALALTDAAVRWSPSGLTFYVRAVNRGNVILTGVHGAVAITDGRGRTVEGLPLGPGTFVTGSSIEIPVLAQGARPRPGSVFTVRAHLDYAGGIATLQTTVRFGHAAAVIAHTYQPESMPAPAGAGAPPWRGPLLGMLGTLAVIGLWRLFVAGRRRRDAGACAPPGPGIVLDPPACAGIALRPPRPVPAGPPDGAADRTS